jgi:hypothetical protein
MEHIDTLLDALTNAKTKSDDDLLTKADIVKISIACRHM